VVPFVCELAYVNRGSLFVLGPTLINKSGESLPMPLHVWANREEMIHETCPCPHTAKRVFAVVPCLRKAVENTRIASNFRGLLG
jgi:hypothetical protein